MDVKGTPKVSDQVMKTVALLMTRPAAKSRNKITFHGEKHSVIVAEPRMPDRPSFEITAVIEPATIGAQKIAPVLLVLQVCLLTSSLPDFNLRSDFIKFHQICS